jgi:hypothetical protein
LSRFNVTKRLRLTLSGSTSVSGDIDFVTGAVANAFTLTGPTQGSIGAAATFTITPNGTMGSAVTVTIAGTNGASVNPLSRLFSAGSSAAQTFTVTRSSAGVSSVSITNNGGLSNFGSPISFSTVADATWSLNPPTISFERGTASTHDLVQYTQNFDPLIHEMQMAEGSNALPTGVTLDSTGVLEYDGTPTLVTPVNVQIDIEDISGVMQNWAGRIASPGVVRHFSFADAAHLGEGPSGAGYGYNYGWYDDGGGSDHPVHDTTIYPTGGGGSLRFELDATRGGGSWVTNFSTDLQTRYKTPGQEFFCQWRQRFDSNSIGPNIAPFGYGQRKQCLISDGDTSYGVWNDETQTGVAGSCRNDEICVQSYSFNEASGSYNDLFPITYHRCPTSGSTLNFEEPNADQFLLLQNGMPAPYCGYNNVNNNTNGTNLPTGNCFVYYPDEWMTFQTGVTLGPTQVGNTIPNSRYRLWMQRQGQPSVLVIDFTFTMTMNPVYPGYGKFWMTYYNAPGGAGVVCRNNTWKTWYSELIISTQRIPDAL